MTNVLFQQTKKTRSEVSRHSFLKNKKNKACTPTPQKNKNKKKQEVKYHASEI